MSAIGEKRQRSEPAADGRRLRGDQSRAAVLQRAVRIASTDGLEGLTIGRLAADLGISKGNITVLFGDKEALQLRTLDWAIDEFVERVVAPLRDVASPTKRLIGLCDGWFDFVETRVLPGGCMTIASTSEYRARPGAIQDRVKAHRDAWLQLLTKTVAAAKEAGEMRSEVDPGQVAFEITAFQSAANSASLIGDPATFKRARRTCRRLIDSLATAPGPRRAGH